MTQHLLFEEDGAYKAGTVLSATDASMQVELASGKRTKVKASHVVLRFDQPSPSSLLANAQREAEKIDVDFLWEVAPQQEFGFQELAREYVGRAPSALESAAILLKLHGAPVYFHRKGRGRFRPAPPDVLKAALAAVERKRQQEERKQRYIDEIAAGRMPDAIAQQAVQLIVRPDRGSIEFKALEQAAAAAQATPLRLLLARGAITSPLDWHLRSFLETTFPRGTGFDDGSPRPEHSGLDDLPLADVAAFSIDDSTTSEIDDAFSVQAFGSGVRVGIHIAAPAAVIARDHPVDSIARARMSTVYAPGIKITMLPPEWIAAFSLDAGRIVAVLSLYLDVDRDGRTVSATRTAFERIRIAANLRHDELDARVTDDTIAAGALNDVPFAGELAVLWRLANSLLADRERVRGKPEPRGRVDYSIDIDTAGGALHPDARVSVRARRRGAPLDLIVAELMIFANSLWGGVLAQRKQAGVYRSQSFERSGGRALGRVRMSTTPSPHDGIGVDHYAWCTSPLRRYVDLVNQRQLIAVTDQTPVPYGSSDADLFAVVSGFDAAYTAYADFQTRMERYWCLRWLRQEKLRRVAATVLKGDVLRVDGLPFIARVPGLPAFARGQRLELDLLDTDEVELTIEARLHQILATPTDDGEVGAEEEISDDELIEPEESPPPAIAAESGLGPSGSTVAGTTA